MPARIALGTAQLGGPYGVNNAVGELSDAEAFQVLDAARDCGIDVLDTAEGYGRSEEVIGAHSRRTGAAFRICTKLTGGIDAAGGSLLEILAERISASRRALGGEEIFVYYLHSSELCRDEGLMGAMGALRGEGAFGLLGVSLYDPFELEYILERPGLGIGAVQLPINMLNAGAWMRGGLLARAKEAGLEVFARSVYLQGLVFKSPGDPFVERLGLHGEIAAIESLARDMAVGRARMALDFVRSLDEVDYVVLGCETPAQVRENAGIFEERPCWTREMVARQAEASLSIDPAAVDPRKWSGR